MESIWNTKEPASGAEDWTKLDDPIERRRVQNRIAQRNYRMQTLPVQNLQTFSGNAYTLKGANLRKRIETLEREVRSSPDKSSRALLEPSRLRRRPKESVSAVSRSTDSSASNRRALSKTEFPQFPQGTSLVLVPNTDRDEKDLSPAQKSQFNSLSFLRSLSERREDTRSQTLELDAWDVGSEIEATGSPVSLKPKFNSRFI